MVAVRKDPVHLPAGQKGGCGESTAYSPQIVR